MSSFKRRNTDWQAYGQHRRRAWVRHEMKNQREIETAEQYQARFEKETAEFISKQEQKK